MIKSAILRLTLYYLAILMGLTIGFSFFLYHVSDNELRHGLRRPVPGEVGIYGLVGSSDFDQFRLDRIQEAEDNLRFNLVIFNLSILVMGGFVSYLLATRTLEPIEAAMESQSRFTADASHELRTPLTAMQSEIEVALRQKDLKSKDARELLQSNLEEVNKLRALSENLLKLARQTDQALELKLQSLEDIAIDATTAASRSAKAKNIKIENKVPPINAAVDASAMREVFNILIDNAIKYSPSKSTVSLDAKEVGDKISMTVKDQGKGISKADLPHIFNRFYRAESSRTTSGYGLGLSIAQQLVELHHGTLNVKSIPKKGSTFTISLPRAIK